VTWADDTGRGGIFFSQLTPPARRQLKAWLTKRDKKKTRRSPVKQRVPKERPGAAPLHWGRLCSWLG